MLDKAKSFYDEGYSAGQRSREQEIEDEKRNYLECLKTLNAVQGGKDVLEMENTALEAELERVKFSLSVAKVTDDERSELSNLKAENKRLREALEFYANKENWEKNEKGRSIYGVEESIICCDLGTISREALKTEGE